MQIVAKSSASWSGRAAMAVVAGAIALVGCSHDAVDHGVADGYSIKDSRADMSTSRPVVRAKLDGSERASRTRRHAGAHDAAPVAATASQVAASPTLPTGDYIRSAPVQSPVQDDLPVRRPIAQQIDQSCRADADCSARVAELVADQGATWLRVMPTLADDLSGARFVAVRNLRPKLSCEEIELARGTLAGSQERLSLIVRRASGEGDEQAAAAGAMNLAGAVLGDLAREHELRCK